MIRRIEGDDDTRSRSKCYFITDEILATNYFIINLKKNILYVSHETGSYGVIFSSTTMHPHIKPSYRKLLQHVPHALGWFITTPTFDMNIMPSLMPQAMS